MSCEKYLHREVCDQSSRQIWSRMMKEEKCSDFTDSSYYINKIPIVQTLTLIKQQERLTGDIAIESAEGWYRLSEISKGIEIGIQVAIDLISKEPTAEAAEVVHGEWIEGKSLEKCSICGKKGFPDWRYCPNCGAKMDGGKE